MNWIGEEEEFSEEETTLLLHGASPDQLSEETTKKLTQLSILDDLGILPRNLGVFFKKNE